jgi:hypothetical protein
MRFMMLMIPKDYAQASVDRRPDADTVARMMKYNQSLIDAGVMLTGEGLHPPAAGTRVHFSKGKPKIVDGPFTEAKEMIGGYWMIQVRSRAEAVEWASRCPADDGDMIEVRQVFDMADFPPDVQAAASVLKP